jgi:predicted nucleic acid-binding Zn ribbon protein
MPKPLKNEITASKHKHCIVCGTPVEVNQDFCSENCEKEFEKLARRRKYTVAMGVFLPVILTIILIIVLLLRRA